MAAEYVARGLRRYGRTWTPARTHFPESAIAGAAPCPVILGLDARAGHDTGLCLPGEGVETAAVEQSQAALESQESTGSVRAGCHRYGLSGRTLHLDAPRSG